MEEKKVETKKDVKIKDKIVEKSIEMAAKEMTEMFQDTENIALAEAAIQNNEIEFEHEGQTYRVRKSNYLEKQEANKFRMKKYIELLKDKDCLLEKDLRKLYKDRGVDIDALDKQMQELTVQQQSLMMDLGKAIKENKDKVELLKYKEEILNIMNSLQGLNAEKQQLLEFSLENRILMEVYSYMIWMIAEHKVKDTWTKIWPKYEDFLATDTNELLNKVTKHGAVIISEEMTARNLV